MELTKQHCLLIRYLLEKEVNRLEKGFMSRPDTAYTNWLRERCGDAGDLLNEIKKGFVNEVQNKVQS